MRIRVIRIIYFSKDVYGHKDLYNLIKLFDNSLYIYSY